MKIELEALLNEETDIMARQKILKGDLYGRFGTSINLEDK